MASDTDTATPEPGRRTSLLDRLGGWLRRNRDQAANAVALDAPSLLRRRRHARRSSPLTRRILLLNIVDRKSTRLNSSHVSESRMPSSA